MLAVQDTTAVIMAGGKGARIGAMEGDLPKCLLPVAGEQPLLTRQIDQMQIAGITDILVCCSVANADIIRPFLKKGARAVACENCKLGPLPALAEVLTCVSTSLLLLSLADIYFMESPFAKLHHHHEACLVTGTDRQGSTGGVTCNEELVLSISYHPEVNQIRHWTGVFLFHKDRIPALSHNLDTYHDAPIEDWIQDLVDGGMRCTWIDGGAFVNVNRMADYQYLLDVERP